MKTTSFRSFLIPGGSILAGLIFFGGINKSIKEVLFNELANFDIKGLYAVVAMLAVSIGIYFFATRSRKEAEKPTNVSFDHSIQRPIHRRTVIKKTA